MPRVAIKKTTYKVTDFSKWLKSEMAYRGMTQSDLARLLNVEQATVSYKLKNGTFDLKDIMAIMQEFKPEPSKLQRIFY